MLMLGSMSPLEISEKNDRNLMLGSMIPLNIRGKNSRKKIIDLDSLECPIEANTRSTDTSIRPQHYETQNHRFGQLRVLY